jgi:hypothetical protein
MSERAANNPPHSSHSVPINRECGACAGVLLTMMISPAQEIAFSGGFTIGISMFR